MYYFCNDPLECAKNVADVLYMVETSVAKRFELAAYFTAVISGLSLSLKGLIIETRLCH